MTQEQEQHLRTFIAALRSPQYCQVTARLKSDTRPECFCAEGLACETYRLDPSEAYWTAGWFYPSPEAGPFVICASSSFLTNYFGLTNEENLVALNDTDKKSFLEIADYLENKYFNGPNRTTENQPA